MLKITIPAVELYDEVNNEFIQTKAQELQLEHSLVSLSKWESKWNKPFLSKENKTVDEIIDYIRCMTLTQHVDDDVYKRIDNDILNQVMDYIKAPMTATTINNRNDRPPSREIMTAEVIYYYMIALGIPIEFQKWHLNRLFTLINVCSIKNAPSKKMSRREALAQQQALNAARRKR